MRWLAAALLIFATAAQAQTPLTGTTGAPLSPRTGSPAVPVTPKPMGVAPPSAMPPASATSPASTSGMAPATGTGTSNTGRHRKLQERFDDANTTHDGHLTLEQARAKMPSVARDFDAIDTGHKGYVTVDQIKDYRKARGAARRAARGTKGQ